MMACPKTNDTLRKEAGILKQLQSIYGWRGSLVDAVIDELVIPRMRRKVFPSEDEIINYSQRLMQKQLQFAKAKRYRQPGVTKSGTGNVYCALFDLEYNGKIDEKQLDQAREEVVLALKNLVRSDFLQGLMAEEPYVVSQRSIRFEFEGVSVVCKPDLLVFFEDKPPLIIDWKVRSLGSTDAWLQLGLYGIALSRVRPHRDFANKFRSTSLNPEDIGLIEYQLLINQRREYSISEEDITDIEDYIFGSITAINRIVNGRKYHDLQSRHFPKASYPNVCERCGFRKLCSKDFSFLSLWGW
jgi:hypothetical protein